jgi:hypothetical protein
MYWDKWIEGFTDDCGAGEQDGFQSGEESSIPSLDSLGRMYWDKWIEGFH